MCATCTTSESLWGSFQLKPVSRTTWMVTPIWVVTAHGSVREVKTTSALGTTPQGGFRGAVMVGVLVAGLVVVEVGLRLGGMAEEPQDARRTTPVVVTSTLRRRPRKPRSGRAILRVSRQTTSCRPRAGPWPCHGPRSADLDRKEAMKFDWELQESRCISPEMPERQRTGERVDQAANPECHTARVLRSGSPAHDCRPFIIWLTRREYRRTSAQRVIPVEVEP
jgi:hypothetical protein